MQDSPLSITASVTGILTFVAAILAFVYVRYITLQNAHEEVIRIVGSVAASIIETTRVIPIQEDADSGQAGHENVDIEVKIIETADNLKQLSMEIYLLEFRILKMMLESQGLNVKFLSVPTTGSDRLWLLDNLSRAADSMQRKFTTTKERTLVPNQGYGIFTIFHAVAHLLRGSSSDIRWYRIRGEVLKMVQEREALRSRLSFHQLQTINLRLKISQRESNELTVNLEKFRSRFEEHRADMEKFRSSFEDHRHQVQEHFAALTRHGSANPKAEILQ